MASFSFPEWLAIGGVAAVVVSLSVTSRAGTDTDLDEDNFREDVMMCEEAAARLAECCPSFLAPQLQCRHRIFHEEETGCGTSSARHEETHPALPLEESRCIRSSSCDSLRANRVCERALKAAPITSAYERTGYGEGSTTYDGRKSGPREKVCP